MDYSWLDIFSSVLTTMGTAQTTADSARLRSRGPRTAGARLEQDAEALHEALSALVRVYQFRDRDRICCHDVSVTQCYALEALLRRGPSTLNELAAELYLDKSTASRVVDALERKRYVTRAPHPEDGRALRLTPTAAGRRLHDRIRQDLIDEEKALLHDLKPAVRQAATRLIGRLARAAELRSGVRGRELCCAGEPRER